MSGPTVSVVMPAFNVAETIEAALESIEQQTRQPDEVVIVDDRSTDDTATRAEAWAGRLPLVVVRNEVNVGCGVARATAIGVATGDIIAPLDADDIWLTDHLATLVPLATDPSVIVATKQLTWQPERGVDEAVLPALSLPDPADQPDRIFRHNFLFSGSLAWRQAIVSIGGGSPARRADDWENWIRLFIEAGCRAVPAPHPTVLHRIHLGSLSVLDGCLPEEVELLDGLLTTPGYEQYHSTIRAAARRRRARGKFLAGSQAAEHGETSTARKLFAQAIFLDPTLSGGFGPGAIGSVALRSLAGFVSPSLATRARRSRLERQSLLDPKPIEKTTQQLGPDADEVELAGGRIVGH